MADKFGRRANFIFGGIASGIMALVFTYGTTPNTAIYIAALFGFITYGYWGPLAAFVSEQFPTAIRGAGVSFAWGNARVVTGLTPFLLGGLAMKTSLQFAIACMSVIYASGAIFAYFMKETMEEKIIIDGKPKGIAQ